MAEGSWIRLTTISANQIKSLIDEVVDKKSQRVVDNKALRHDINDIYIQVVTPYVPYKTGKLNNAYQTNDGRIIWSAVNRGYNYARIQYENELYEHPSRGEGHKPTAHWTDMVMPGTQDWENKFIPQVKEIIIQAYKNG